MPKQGTQNLEKKRYHERVLLKNSLNKCFMQNLDLYFLDETVFVYKQQAKTWSLPNTTIKSYHFNMSQVNLCLILCVNKNGLVCYNIQQGYLDEDDYLEFLKLIRQTIGNKRIGLLYDGLALHKGKKPYKMMSNNRWVHVLNEAWTSDNNPIETYIGLVKRYFYKRRLQFGANPNIINGSNVNDVKMKQLIEQALNEYRYFDMTKIIDSCLLKIKKRLSLFNLKLNFNV